LFGLFEAIVGGCLIFLSLPRIPAPEKDDRGEFDLFLCFHICLPNCCFTFRARYTLRASFRHSVCYAACVPKR
jgi:hypothetical protein